MRKLRTNHFTVLYENGSLRQIKVGNTEVLRMIYSAVRDRNWGTIEPIIENETIESGENLFEICLTVGYHAEPIHFSAEYRITGRDNKIRFEMNGTALSDFLKNRIGFCVLHPIRECAGKTATAIHPDGSMSEFGFPELISPTQPVKNVQSMIWEAAPEINAQLDFLGDIFEMEDQRNWTDASFKTYCTPLEKPFPAEIKSGDTVSQVIELKIETAMNQDSNDNVFVFSWDTEKITRLPSLGTSISSRKETLTHSEIALLEKLPFNHLRVEVKMSQPDFSDVLEKAAREGKLLSWPLFVVLYFSTEYSTEYQRFIDTVRELDTKISHILLTELNHLPFEHFNELAQIIKTDFPEVEIGTGVNAYFAELNRSRPTIENADFVSFTISPQVHAFDDASLVENLEAQAEVIKSAKKLFPEKPIYVSPVSLKQRFNVVATTAEPDPAPGTLPSSVDARQRLAFAASWTLGSLKFLAKAGCQLISYYETVGWKGFIQGDKTSPAKRYFPAEAHEIFPVYGAMKEISEYNEIVHTQSSHPLFFDGLLVKSDQSLKLFLFSFSSEEMEIRLTPDFQASHIRSLVYPEKPEFTESGIMLRPGDLVVIEN